MTICTCQCLVFVLKWIKNAAGSLPYIIHLSGVTTLPWSISAVIKKSRDHTKLVRLNNNKKNLFRFLSMWSDMKSNRKCRYRLKVVGTFFIRWSVKNPPQDSLSNCSSSWGPPIHKNVTKIFSTFDYFIWLVLSRRSVTLNFISVAQNPKMYSNFGD